MSQDTLKTALGKYQIYNENEKIQEFMNEIGESRVAIES